MRKRDYGGTKTPDVLSPPKKRRSKHARNIRAKNSTAYKEANKAAKRAVAMA